MSRAQLVSEIQAGMWLGFLLISVVPLLIKGQLSLSINLTRITPNDIINGGIVCPNLHPVEITCVGIEVPVLQWRRNGTNIGGGFSIASNNGAVQQEDSFILILDSITTRDIVANMTSRLVTNISTLNSGDRIGCVAVMQDTRTLDYILREHPPKVPTNIPVSIERNGATVDISIAWDSAFNLLHDVSSYRVVASGESAASCPSSCDPSGPCMCTGLGIGVDTTITITAINCGDLMGTPVEVIARPRVPSRPSVCSVVPVYSSAGNLAAVDLTWTIASNPPEFLPGVSQNVTDYSIVVGMMDPMTIPASIACSTSTCNYSVQSLSVFSSPLSASVSAVNVIGRGEVCTPQTEIDIRNRILSLTLDTTNIGNQTIACILHSAEECEFCYSAGDSCQNLACIPATETPTLLPSLTELTYCYRATASVSGNAVAVIQDTFNTACPPAALGTTIDGPTDSRCSSDSMGSVSIPHGLGCYDGQKRGALTNYQCDKWYALSGGSSRTCMGDGNWDGEVPECRLSGGNIALLVFGILLCILSITLTVFAAVNILKKEVSLKDRSLFNFHILPLYSKIIYIILFAIECVFLPVVLALWISAGAIPGRPNSGSQQTSLLIAALVLALPWIAGALIFFFVMTKCSNYESGDSHKKAESGKSEQSHVTIKTPSPPVYAIPDKSKKKNRQPEVKEHKPKSVQQNIGKSKGFLVKKGKGKNKALENIELPSYDVLEGPGHHTGKPAPKAPVTQEKYDVLDVKGQQVDDHAPVNQPGVYSTIPGEAQCEAEYSQVDKRSSQKRLLSQTSSDKQKS